MLDYFLNRKLIKNKDGVEVVWSHAVNSKAKLKEAIESNSHMIEADVLLQELGEKEPIMAHPPEKDSDVTLQEWLAKVSSTGKGMKLDFKCLEAVLPSVQILAAMKDEIKQPVWINADIIPGPGGKAIPVDANTFVQTVTSFLPNVTLSLGWTTGWSPGKENKGYSWDMVREMEKVCNTLTYPVTFPVRAALLRDSWPQIHWLLMASDRYSLTVWAGLDDIYPVEDLLYIRENTEKHRVFYDLFEPQNSDLKRAIEQMQM
ncbi:hypothetical protein GDO86_002276 [Hymenochirus boettgeri]|uniref:Menorin-like domain-containing protein n=1 Tax=Hymenochirus boettgeri TaxID=247094 RepID=A0A8T2KPC6_9PIPI|nr:hypothetical protein GDO86_002276 [Hymenochirus boettgeri]